MGEIWYAGEYAGDNNWVRASDSNLLEFVCCTNGVTIIIIDLLSGFYHAASNADAV